MNAKNTWTWLAVAGALFAFIFFFERHWGKPPPGPPPLLPGFKAAAVTQFILFSEALPHREIRVQLTNANWWLTQPVRYPAQKSRIVGLLAALEQLVPAASITPGELQRRAGTEGEFGLENSPTTLVIQQDDLVTTLKFGQRTAPGDQVFAQVVGREDVFVLDAAVLLALPNSVDDWRDTALIAFQPHGPLAISITNASRVIRFQLDPSNHLWRLRQPLPARADGSYLLSMLEALKSSSASGFLPPEGRPDLESLGLQPPELSLAFTQGDGSSLLLQFGRTNAAGQCFARRDGLDSILTVPPEILAPWRQEFFKFRDLQLLALPPGLTAVEVRSLPGGVLGTYGPGGGTGAVARGEEGFTLERAATNGWRLVGEKFPVDGARVAEFLAQVQGLEIREFVKDVVSTQEFGLYGLTSAVRQLVFKSGAAGAGAGAGAGAAAGVVGLEFGAGTNDVVFARRWDEASVYGVGRGEVLALPYAGWQLREGRLGDLGAGELTRLRARKGGWAREWVRAGTNVWVLGPGSQGVVDGVCVEELARHLGGVRATAWVARGAAAGEDGRFGFGTNSLRVAWEGRSGGRVELEFGGYSAAKYPYARVVLEGEPWVLEFPSALYAFLLSCLAVPPGAP